MTENRTYQAGAVALCTVAGLFTVIPIQAGVSLAAYALPVMMYFLLPEIKAPGQQRFVHSFRGYGVLGAAVYLTLYYLLGVVLKEIAGTPYDLSPAGILLNIGNILPLMILREFTREYSLGVLNRHCRWRKAGIVVLFILMAVSRLNFVKMIRITESEKLFIYIAVEVLPTLTKEILLMVLVYYGGAAAGIWYQGIIEIFLHVFPFLPDLPWIAQSALGIAYPVFFAVFLREMYDVLQRKKKKIEKEDGGFYIGVILAVLFCWFCVGVFPVYPSVILTGSMEPMMDPGDVILINKMKEEKDILKLKKDDVINFDRGPITITHRIVAVNYDEAGNISFRTKGDNNQSEDEQPVSPNEVNGIVQRVIPKAGIPMLLLKSGEKIPEGVVDNEETIVDEG